jgi:basic membrane lipoprotein Med (substrate-binding protein (PBP1-ABC) superfamily)/DNA-binding SARP family transcriptional activator
VGLVEYRILGSLEVAADGQAVDLGPPKQRAVLAVLLLHANEIVAAERLIELVWAGRQPRTAAHSVQIYVSELRRRLDAVGDGRSVIETRAPGYALHADADAVDAWRFERLVAEGSALVRSGEAEVGAATLRAALELWRGAPLSEFVYEEFAQPHIRRWEEARWQAVEELAAAELLRGRPADALAGLALLVEAEPLRERARELELRALYRCGRQADALRAYEGFRKRLADELGIDPSPALQQLQGRILLQDPGLAPAAAAGERGARNPFKGLRAFTEADAGDFFGRRRLVEQLCARLEQDAPLLAVLGPSGCGKSSLAAAGLIPALRADAVPGSKGWLIAAMVPGAHPAGELQAALETAGDLSPAHLDVEGTGRLAAAVAGLPSGATLLLVIDQFEELFSLADETERSAFIADLTATLRSAGGRLRVVVTLRADFYDRPLLEPALAPLFTAGVVAVVPPAAEDLEAAMVEPARRVDVAVEPALLAELVADAVGQPGALPLFQYTLTELFDRRDEATVTLASYRQLGGMRGAVSRRADHLYRSLTSVQQPVAEQVFLRLVTLGEGTKDTRRRAAAGELSSLGLDPVDLAEVLERFGRHRLLSFDRDAASGDATVEVAHEALLLQWGRLRGWIDDHRADLRAHEGLAVAVAEWQAAGRDPDYLLAGSRLARHDTWSQGTDLRLTAGEQAFLDASRARRRAEQEQAAAQQAREAQLQQRLALALDGTRPPDVALLFDGRGLVGLSQMIAAGLDDAVVEFGLVAREVAPVSEARLRLLSDHGVPLIVVVTGLLTLEGTTVPTDHPDTTYAFIDCQGEAAPNVTSTRFAEEQGSFLVGAAAGLKTETASVGFIGGVDIPLIWKFQAGFQAGVRHVDPDMGIDSVYLSQPPDFSGFTSPTLAARAAAEMYRSGADVIYHAAGASGLGLLETAVAESRAQGRHLWAIGVDIDEHANETDPLWKFGPEDWRPHILTSMIKRMDVAVYRTVQDFTQGTLTPGERVYDLADGGVEYATSGGFVDDIVPELERLKLAIIDGRIQVPTVPAS